MTTINNQENITMSYNDEPNFSVALKPFASVALLTAQAAFDTVPELAEALRVNNKASAEYDTRADMVALAKQGLLVVWLPTEFASYLPQIADRTPSAQNCTSLDLKEVDTLATWSLTSDGGEPLEVSLPLVALEHALVSVPGADLSSTRTVFIAGQQAAISKIYWDGDDVAEAQGACMCSQSYFEYTSEQQADAAARTAAAGSNRPWENEVWFDDVDGVSRLGLAAYRFS